MDCHLTLKIENVNDDPLFEVVGTKVQKTDSPNKVENKISEKIEKKETEKIPKDERNLLDLNKSIMTYLQMLQLADQINEDKYWNIKMKISYSNGEQLDIDPPKERKLSIFDNQKSKLTDSYMNLNNNNFQKKKPLIRQIRLMSKSQKFKLPSSLMKH